MRHRERKKYSEQKEKGTVGGKRALKAGLYLVLTPSNIPVSMKNGQTHVVCTPVQPSA